jgi:hypothetical protein
MNKIDILHSKLATWNLTPLFKMENYTSCIDHYDFKCNKCGDVFRTSVDSLRKNNKGCNKCRLTDNRCKKTIEYTHLLKLKNFSYYINGDIHTIKCDLCDFEKSYSKSHIKRSYIEKMQCKKCQLLLKEKEKLKILQDIKDKNIKNKEIYEIISQNKVVICGIYKLTSPTGKIYIGQSKDIYSRWIQHKSASKKKHPKLYYSIKKYGFEYFSKEIVEVCDKEMLSDREKYYIKYYNSFNNGLNSTTGGESNYNRSEETKQKLRIILTGRKTNGNIPFSIDGVSYRTIQEAHEKLGIPLKTIHNRLNSNNIKFNRYVYDDSI